MSSTIRDTVTETMRSDSRMSGYTQYATPVIAALEQREWDMAEALVSYAASHGLPETDAREALAQRGMTFRPVIAAAPQPSNGGERSTQDELASIRHDAASLVERIDRVLG